MQTSTPTADLGALKDHVGTTGASTLDSFREDLTRGALLTDVTVYTRYSNWS